MYNKVHVTISLTDINSLHMDYTCRDINTCIPSLILNTPDLFYNFRMVAYFCHHLSDNYVALSDLYLVLSVLYVDLSDLYVDLKS